MNQAPVSGGRDDDFARLYFEKRPRGDAEKQADDPVFLARGGLLEVCAGCGDVAEFWGDGGSYCYGCASCEVCQSPYCDKEEHRV